MPNTKSAERRMRSSARKEARHHAVRSFLKKLEKQYTTLLDGGKKDKAPAALRELFSALDKAVKGGTVKRTTVDRKKSRLTLRLNRAK